MNEQPRFLIGRPVSIGLLILAAVEGATVLAPAIGQPIGFGADLDLYLGATQRLFQGGSFYPPDQLAGPFAVTPGTILYPPTTIPLFAAFIVLPRLMWWVIPLGLIGYLVSRWKPSTFGWSVIAVCLAFPNSIVLLVNGNPVMWAMAAMAVAMPHRWVSAFVLLKPSLAPLSVIGIKDWRWWSVLGAAAIVSVALLPLWRDYIAVLGNIRDAGLLYSLGDVPLVLIPGIAWLSRTSNTTLRRDGVTPGHADLPT